MNVDEGQETFIFPIDENTARKLFELANSLDIRPNKQWSDPKDFIDGLRDQADKTTVENKTEEEQPSQEEAPAKEEGEKLEGGEKLEEGEQLQGEGEQLQGEGEQLEETSSAPVSSES